MTSFLTAGWLLEKLNHRQSNRPAWLIFPRARTQFKCVVAATVSNKVVKFSVAVKEYSANADEEKTMWIDIDAWNGLGDRVL